MKYARIVNQCAVDVRSISPENCFTENIVAEFQEVPDAVIDGWFLSGTVWSAPVPYVPTAADLARLQQRNAELIAAERESKCSEIRNARDLLLAKSDWTQLPDVPQAIKDKWVTHRKALRDVPQQAGFPFNVVWPT